MKGASSFSSAKLDAYLLAEVDFDFLCARFVRDDNLTRHDSSPFCFYYFCSYLNSGGHAKFRGASTRIDTELQTPRSDWLFGQDF